MNLLARKTPPQQTGGRGDRLRYDINYSYRSKIKEKDKMVSVNIGENKKDEYLASCVSGQHAVLLPSTSEFRVSAMQQTSEKRMLLSR